MITITIQLKEELADKNFTPEEDAYWWPVGRMAAGAVLQMNTLFADQMIHGPLKANPESETWEGLIGDVSTPPNKCGVMSAVFSNYAALKIPFLPEGMPFILYIGDSSEQVQIGTDPETGDPIYETIYGGEIQ